jgi:tetratricopeptide (TPR) repeat protein
MLVLVAEDAARRLAQREDGALIHDRHAAAYVALAERAAPELIGPRRAIWLQLVAEQHPNLLAAYHWTTTKPDADRALRLVAAMWRFWQMDGQLDAAAQRTEVALALEDGTPEARAKALEAAGGIDYRRGDFDRQFDRDTAALAMWRGLGNRAEIANALYNLAYVTQIRVGFEAANALLEEAEQIYLAAGDRVGLGHVHWSWGNIYQIEVTSIKQSHPAGAAPSTSTLTAMSSTSAGLSTCSPTAC